MADCKNQRYSWNFFFFKPYKYLFWRSDTSIINSIETKIGVKLASVREVLDLERWMLFTNGNHLLWFICFSIQNEKTVDYEASCLSVFAINIYTIKTIYLSDILLKFIIKFPHLSFLDSTVTASNILLWSYLDII